MAKIIYISTSIWLIVCGGFIVWQWHLLPPQIPVWYNLPGGIEQLGSPVDLWKVWMGILSIGAVVEILRQVNKTDTTITSIIIITGVVVQLILSLGILRILWVVV